MRSNHARGGSKAAFLQDSSLEPPRRFAPPLLTQEGSRATQIQFIHTFIDRAYRELSGRLRAGGKSQGGKLESRIDYLEPSRHFILSSERGVVTELERLETDEYIIRYHKSSADAVAVLETGSWIGFRYRDAHWSFLKQ